MKKRILAMLLTVCMVFSMLPMSALAARIVDDVPLAALPTGDEVHDHDHDHDHAHEAALPSNATDAAQLAEVTAGETAYTPADAEAEGYEVHYFAKNGTTGWMIQDTPATVTIKSGGTAVTGDLSAGTAYTIHYGNATLVAPFSTTGATNVTAQGGTTNFNFVPVEGSDGGYQIKVAAQELYLTHTVVGFTFQNNPWKGIQLAAEGETFHITPAADPNDGTYHIWYATETAPVVAQLGTSAAFNGGQVDLSKALYTWRAHPTSGVEGNVFSNTIPGTSTTVYLNIGGGDATKPNQASANSVAATTVSQVGNSALFRFQDKMNANKSSSLHFHTASGELHFNRCENAHSPEHDFALFRPANEGETSSVEISGYVRLTALNQLVTGGQYLIAMQAVDNNWYVLYPAEANADQYDHVAKVVTMSFTEDIRDEGINIAADNSALDIEGVTATAPSQANHTTNNDGGAEKVVDGITTGNNKWHTRYNNCGNGTGHTDAASATNIARYGENYIQLSLEQTTDLVALRYLPRQDSSANGIILSYEVRVSTDEINWTTVARGNTTNGNAWANNHNWKIANFGRVVNAKYVRLYALTAATNDISACEIALVAAPAMYTVTFAGDGVTEEPLQVMEGESIALPEPAAREGFKFLGWFDASDNMLNPAAVTVNADMTVTAKWVDLGTNTTVEYLAPSNGKMVLGATKQEYCISVQDGDAAGDLKALNTGAYRAWATSDAWVKIAEANGTYYAAAEHGIGGTNNNGIIQHTYTRQEDGGFHISIAQNGTIYYLTNKLSSEGGLAYSANEADAATFYVTRSDVNAENGGNKFHIWTIIPPTEYTVTFNNEDGTAAGTATVIEGEAVGAVPEADEQEGKTFLGWYTGAGELIHANTPVTADITATAYFADTAELAVAAATDGNVDATPSAPSVQDGYPVENANDNNAGSLWHSRWGGGAGTGPDLVVSGKANDYTFAGDNYLQLDLGGTQEIDSVRYLPRQNSEAGRILKYTVRVSADGENYITVATGTWETLTDEGGADWKTVSFKPINAQYVRLYGHLTHDDEQNNMTVAELHAVAVPVTVTFRNGEAEVATAKARTGGTVALPTDTLEAPGANYKQDGWVLEGTDTPFTAETPVTEAITVTAKWVLDTNTAVAKIGETYYWSLQGAFDQAADGAEIVLLKDVSTYEAPATFNKDAAVTLKTGEYTVDGVITVNGGKLTVNGNFKNYEHGHEGTDDHNFVVNGGELVIAGGTFEAGCTVVYVTGAGAATVNGGDFTVTNTETYGTKYLLNQKDGDRETASITVNGGTFHNYDPSASASENPQANFLPEDKAAVLENGAYTVEPAAATLIDVATGAAKGYATVADAIDAADLGDTVKFLADANITIPNEKAVQINKNGHEVNIEAQALTRTTGATQTVDGVAQWVPGSLLALYGGVEAGLEAEAKLRVPGATYKGYTRVDLYADWTLADDVILPSRNTSTTTVYAMTDVTIDLAGHTLAQENKSDNGWNGYPAVSAYGGNLTVKDGSESQSGKIEAATIGADVYPDRTLTLASGTISSHYDRKGIIKPDGSVLAGYENSYGAVIRHRGGTFTMTGGKLAVEADAGQGNSTIRLAYDSSPTAASYTINISAGNVDAVSADKQVDPVLNRVFSGNAQIMSENENVTFNVTGGTFGADVTKFCADGYWSLKDGEAETWTVQKKVVARNATTGTEYSSLQAALSEAGGSGQDVIVLLADVAESVTVPQNAHVTLKLNGRTLTNEAGKDTITNNGFLIITGEGTVDNVSDECAALVNEGIAQLNGGEFTRSLEDGQDNTYYNIVNHDMMFIDGASVTQEGNFSSLIENGYYNGANESGNPTLNISGGAFSGGLNTIKNDDRGTLDISGGTFTNATQAVVLNWNVATIREGDFTLSAGGGNAVVLNGGGNETLNKGELNIYGGAFEGNGAPVIKAMNGKDEYLDGVKVYGGTFSTNVNQFCVDGSFSHQNAEGKYTIQLKGTVKSLHEGGVVNGDAVTYGEGTTLAFTAEGNDEGRDPNHWWAGIEVVAPEGVDVTNAKYRAKEPWVESFRTNTWAENTDHTFWGPVDQKYIDRFGGDEKALTFIYEFDWDGDGVYDQTITMTAQNGINLLPGLGTVTALNDGGVVDGNAVTYGEGTTLQFTAEGNDEGRAPNHWWAGIKVTAPEGVSADAKYAVKEPWAADFRTNDWSKNSDGTFWGQADQAYIDRFGGEKKELVFTYKFDWDGNGEYEQTVTMTIQNGIQLNTDDAVATTGGLYYGTLKEAVDAAENGGTVELLKSVSGSGVIVNKSVTIDFGGNTYTVDRAPLAGSGEKYATQAFQLLAGADKANPHSVTMKNGTIVLPAGVDNLKMGIQNYSNLTLEDMTLDASGNSNISYVVSNNNGNTTITGKTTIKAPAGSVAFDVYDYAAQGYQGVKVVVDSDDVVVEGAIEVSEGKAELAISGGTYSTDVNQWCVEGYVAEKTEGEQKWTVTLDRVAKIISQDGTETLYPTLAEAVKTAENGDEIVLLKDVTESVTIAKGQNVILNLNGKTLTNDPKTKNATGIADTIYVEMGATLTVNGEGHVVNVTDQAQTVFNEGTVTLNGGSYERTAEKGYVIVNHGAKMTINEGVTVTTTNNGSALVVNGYMNETITPNETMNWLRTMYQVKEHVNEEHPVMEITGGSFTGGKHVVSNDNYGVMSISGEPVVTAVEGSVNAFRNEALSTATIEGGVFTGNVLDNNVANKGLQISGGKFNANVNLYCVDGKCQDPAKYDGVVGDHRLIEVPEVPAQVGKTGVKAHEKCDVCGKLFLNNEMVEEKDLIIPARTVKQVIEEDLDSYKFVGILASQPSGDVASTLITATVDSGYNGKLVVPGATVNTKSLILGIGMKGVENLGLKPDETRVHVANEMNLGNLVDKEINLGTDFMGQIALAMVEDGWNNAVANTTVKKTNKETSNVTYNMIAKYDMGGALEVNANTNAADARTAFKAIVEHASVTTDAAGDSKAVIKKGSWIQLGQEKAEFEADAQDLTLDNLASLNGNLFRNTVKLTKLADADNTTIKMVLKKGSVLAVGDSKITLNNDAVITVENVDPGQVASGWTILSQIQEALNNPSKRKEILVTLGLTVASFPNRFNNKTMNITVEFICEHEDLTLVPLKPATVNEEGMLAHYVCETCGKLFDAETKAEIKDETTLIIPKLEAVAAIGESKYASLQEAVNAVEGEGQTVTLLKDTTENVVVAEGKDFTLDLNGNTLYGNMAAQPKVGSVLTNYGKLVIADSSDAKDSKITRDETGATDHTGHDYIILNNGTLRLENVTIEGTCGRTGNPPSTISNGQNKQGAILVIDGATVTNTLGIAVKNNEGCTVTVNSGTVSTEATNYAAVMNWGEANLLGGEITGKTAVQTRTYKSFLAITSMRSADPEKPLIVKGEVIQGKDADATMSPTTEITGGKYTALVNEFCLNHGLANGYCQGKDGWVDRHNTNGSVEHKDATCTEAGVQGGTYCDKCNLGKDAAEAVITAPGHKMTKTEAKAATCTEPGNVEYWTCSVCKKNFSDEAGTTELNDVAVPAAGHKMTKTEAKAATCTEPGNVEYWTCSVCEKNFSDEAGTTVLDDVVVPAAGHKLDAVAEIPAQIGTPGVKAHYECSVCHEKFQDAEGKVPATKEWLPIPALDGQGKVEALNAGAEVAKNAVTYGEATTLQFTAEGNDEGRAPNHWWAGIKVTAPEGTTADATYAVKEPWAADFRTNDWSKNSDGTFWGQADQAYIDRFGGETEPKALTFTYKFDWNGDGTYDQTVTMTVKDGIKLDTANAVATTGGLYYGTLQEAINAATAEGQTVTLLKDTTEKIVVAADKNIALDLSGKTVNGPVLSGKATGSVLTNNGTLVIKDSEGNGKITRDETGATDHTGHDYIILNNGELTLEGGEIASQCTRSNAPSTIANGLEKDADGAKLTIKGGKVTHTSGIAVKNDETGTLVMEGGEVSTQADNFTAILNWKDATITGGKITGKTAVQTLTYNSTNASTVMKGSVEVSGKVTQKKYNASAANAPKTEITGGKFDTDVNPFCKDHGEVNGYCQDKNGVVAQHVVDTTVWSKDGESHWHACSRCDYKFDNAEHTWDKGVVHSVANCTQDGEKTYTCTICGETKTEVTEALGHNNYGTVAHKDATCTEPGVVGGTYCTRCGEGKAAAEEAIEALGHDFAEEFTVDKEATCTEAGSKSKHCSRCDAKDEVTEIPVIEHSWGEWTVVTVATCKDEGIEKRVCSVCNTEETRTTGTNPDNHAGGTEVRGAVAATCIDAGYTGDTFCLGCDTKIADGTAIEALGHNSLGYVEPVAATCTTPGVKGGHYCDRCDEGKAAAEAETEALGHDMKEVAGTAKAATCTEAGKEADKACSRCDHTETGATIDALGHNTDGVIVHKDATCTEPGVVGGTYCTRCENGKADAEAVIPANGHNTEGHVEHVDATCTVAGVVGGTYCTVCNEGKAAAEAVIEALGHNNLGYVAHKDATCTETGIVGGHYCDRCDEGKEAAEATIAMRPHDMRTVEGSAVAPTCTEAGKEADKKCFYCDHTETGAEINKLGHDLVRHDAVNPTCTEKGNIEYWTCGRCDKVFSDAAGENEITLAETVLAARGHTNSQTPHRDNHPATCTEDGLEGKMECSVCHEIVNPGTVIPKLGHAWDEGEVTKAATCTDKGMRVHTCTREGCGETKVELIDALGHDYSTTEWSKDGESHWHACSRCDSKADVAAHSWNDGEITTPATCTEDGVMTYTCTVCGATRTEAIEAAGHDMTHHDAVAATCTTAGSVEYWSCATCEKDFADEAGATELETTVVAALGHSLTKVEAKAATCTEAGNVEYWACDRCEKNFADEAAENELETVEIAALGHDLTKWAFDETNHWHVCSRCDDVTVTDTPAAHTWDAGVVSGNIRTYTCTDGCGATRTETVSTGGGGGGGSRPTPTPPEEDLNEPDVPLAKPFLFTDVTENDWFYEAVKYVYEKDIMVGVNDEGTLFGPGLDTTRATVATIVHRMENKPVVDAANFTDVLADMWYTDAVNWTDKSGVMIGFGDGTFGPAINVTREQLVTVLYRYAKLLDRDVSATGDLSVFDDAADVSSWASEAMTWAVGCELIKGRNGASLAPQETTTRGELATILQRFLAVETEAEAK